MAFEQRIEILRDAECISSRQDQGCGNGWFKPMHVGGSDSSHHSRTLSELVRLKWMEKKHYGRAFAYRITEYGKAALERINNSAAPAPSSQPKEK